MTPARGYNPDVLTCLANLSNDEVFTPPAFAARMLDELPKRLWSDPKATFLDPVTKTGVFLREITRRLNDGLRDTIPNDQERLNHILTKQVHGIAITDLTALLARRSLYCSKKADGKYSICTAFDEPEGRVLYRQLKHTWVDGKCSFCGGPRTAFDRPDDLESHAYWFIHTRKPEDIFGMKFDVVVGNPPYQLSDGGHSASARPIYHKFVKQAKRLRPTYLSMVIPARWYSGGKGLDDFRKDMLKDRRLRRLVDYPQLYDGFAGVKIRGGICYFLWDKNHDGDCTIQTMIEGKTVGPPVARRLDEFDVLVRRNEAVSVLRKVRAKERADGNAKTFRSVVSSSRPFGFRTNFHGADQRGRLKNPVMLHGSQRKTWIARSAVVENAAWIDKWKVLMTAVQGTSGRVERKFLSKPIVAAPGEVCSETYVVAGVFDDEAAANRCATYLRTRFVRFLVSLRKPAQHASREVYGFVPVVPLDREWTDEQLYERYGLEPSEIEFIEATVDPMED